MQTLTLAITAELGATVRDSPTRRVHGWLQYHPPVSSFCFVGTAHHPLVQEQRAAEAFEASARLDVYKKTGVYSVLKRIEVWQARTGKRLSQGFHGATGERERERTDPGGIVGVRSTRQFRDTVELPAR